MLKAVVEQVDGGAETALGEAARQIAVGADEHRHAGQRAREHQRLVAGRVEAGEDARAVGDDGDAVARDAAARSRASGSPGARRAASSRRAM